MSSTWGEGVGFLLDTNVVSEIRKCEPHPGVLSWFASVPASELFLSVLVIGEIRQGIERLARWDPVRAEVFEHGLKRLTAIYEDRIVPVTTEAKPGGGWIFLTPCRSSTDWSPPRHWCVGGRWSPVTRRTSLRPASAS